MIDGKEYSIGQVSLLLGVDMSEAVEALYVNKMTYEGFKKKLTKE